MTPEQERVVNLVIERAEQACRYVLKHNTDGLRNDGDEEYGSGFKVACQVCEGAIRDQVMRHIAEDIERG